jgi:hypothetical protein
MTKAHTPGPWRFDGPILKAGPNGKHLFELTECSGLGLEATANVSLIAAAPDLLAALDMIYRNAHPVAPVYGGRALDYIVPKELVDAARAAIAKAEGDR